MLAGCSLQKHYGVPTHVVAVQGNCDKSRIVELGAILDLSGSEGRLGQEYLSGLEMAVHQIDSSNGVLKNRSCLEVLYKDDQGSTQVGDRAILDMADTEAATFLAAPPESAVIQFAGADLGKAGVTAISFSPLDETYRPKGYPLTYPVVSSASTQAGEMASYARSHHWSSVAVVALADPAGRDGLKAFLADAARKGLTVTGQETIPPSGKGAAAAIGSLRSGNPAAVAVLADTDGIAGVLSARSQAGWSVPVLATQAAVDGPVVAQIGAAGLNGVYVVVPAGAVTGSTSSSSSGPSASGDVTSFRNQLLRWLHVSHLTGSILPYAEAYDGAEMFAYVANSVNSIHTGDIQTFLNNANYQGLLASYSYTASSHSGVPGDQDAIVPASRLNNGLL